MDIFDLTPPPRYPDNDNSVVGKSPIEEGISRLGRWVGILALVALVIVWLYLQTKVHAPPRATPTPSPTVPKRNI